jgi:hypothetical protein
MAENITELHSVENALLIDLIQESLKNCAYVWNKIAPTAYEAFITLNGVKWRIVISRINTVGGSSSTYFLELFKDDRFFISMSSLVYDAIRQIYETIEEQNSPLIEVEQEVIDLLNRQDCRCSVTHNLVACGGVVVGGTSRTTEDEFDPPSGNCKVQFSGIFIGDINDRPSCFHIFKTLEGQCVSPTVFSTSELVGAGVTDDASNVLPNAHRTTFDSVVVWPGARLTITRGEEQVVDILGPKMVFNAIWRDNGTFGPPVIAMLSKTLVGTDSDTGTLYNDLFPVESRIWSDDSELSPSQINMHFWSQGTTITVDCSGVT